MNTIEVASADLATLYADGFAVCIKCGGSHGPLPADSTAGHCGACGSPCVVGMDLALQLGAVRVTGMAA